MSERTPDTTREPETRAPSEPMTWKGVLVWMLPAALAVGLFVATLRLVKPQATLERRMTS